MRALPLLFLVFMLHSFAVSAEEPPVRVRTDRPSYSVGDVITVTIEVAGKGYGLDAFDESVLAPFEVRSREEYYDEEAGVSVIVMKGSVYETGEFTLPPLEIRGGGRIMKTEPVTIKVASLLGDDGGILRDIKGQVEVKEGGGPLPWLLAMLFVALPLALLLRRAMMSEKPESEVGMETVSPLDSALDELARIEGLGLLRDGRIKEFYSLVSDVVRGFVGKVQGVDAMEMTTAELMNALAERGNSRDDTLERFLRDCDMVKFARYSPSQGEVEVLVERAKGIILEESRRGRRVWPEEAVAAAGD